MHLQLTHLSGLALAAVLTQSVSAGTITLDQFVLPGASTGNVSVGLVSAPNNDNAAAGSPNLVTFSTFFNNGGAAPSEYSFRVAASGGTTEYRFQSGAPFHLVNATGKTFSGFRAELGYGVGANFTASGATDGLDFDTPDMDPAPAMSRFPVLTHGPDVLAWSGALWSSGIGTLSFSVDVPDGIQNFTVRLTPVDAAAVPEPSTFALGGAALGTLALFRRRR